MPCYAIRQVFCFPRPIPQVNIHQSTTVIEVMPRDPALRL